MSAAIASYGNMALLNTGKQGILKELDNGYVEILLGALGAVGNGGWIYDAKGCMNYLNTNPDFLQRLKVGQLKSEWGHPVRDPGMSDAAWFARVHTILESNTCAHIRAIKFTHDTVRDKNGRFVVGIIGEVCAWGKQSDSFSRMLRNPHGDVNFSVRSFTDNNPRTGRKIFTNVINWDHVTVPGIKETTKYNTPSMESEEIVSQLLDQAEFDLVSTKLAIMKEAANSSISMESRDNLLESIELMSMEHSRIQKAISSSIVSHIPSTILNW